MNNREIESQTLPITKGEWIRFSSEMAKRWLATSGKPSVEMARFAAYLRRLRYARQIELPAIAQTLNVPLEQLALLEQGLLKPSDLPSAAWMRLMRLLEGREHDSSLDVAPPDLVETVTTRDASAATGEDAESSDHEHDQIIAEADDDPIDSKPIVPEPQPVLRSRGMDMQQQSLGIAQIKVVGIGGGGSNAVARMFKQRIPGVDYVAVNTDAQHLLHIDVPNKLRMGDQLTRGLGVGGDPTIGREAAEESREDLHELLAGTDMVFLACGMGGGTGTGSAPVIAEIAKELGVLTIATVTKPFSFEGKKRADQAEEGIRLLQPHVDTLILLPNDRLSEISDGNMTAENAFRIADDVLRQGVQAIAELVTVAGDINLDFADVRTVMSGAGPAWMAIGHGRGENRAEEAAKAAMASPLLEAPIEGATRVLLNITGGSDLTLQEVQYAADFVSKLVDPDANIIFGMVTDPKMDDEVRVTVIATGLDDVEQLSISETLEDIIGDTMPEPDEAAVDQETSVELPGFLRRLGLGRRR